MADRPPRTTADAGEDTIELTELPARARRVLSAQDLEGFRALFGSAEGAADPQRRHWARLCLLEQGLAAAAGRSAADRAALLGAVAEGALAALERDPCEPALLQRAGVAMRELGGRDGAEALLAAAARLDPHRDRMAGSLPEPRARERQAPGSTGPAAPAAALADLDRRAAEIAGRARPAEGLRLSLCMIVRDEQEMLPRCLQAAAAAVDEIVIVDTGSTDATIEIARSFGARVIERPWTGSFAEARNTSFDAASGDWLMYLDADEVLVGEDAPLLRSLTGRTWREAFRVRETNHTGSLGDGTAVTHDALRILRNRPQYRFEGRVHEQIAARLPGYLPERVEGTEVRIEHFGYLASVRRERGKSARNIELLRLQAAEEQPSAFLHYNLGCEHAAAGETAEALAEFERAWALLAPGDRDAQEFAPALAARLVRSLLLAGRPEEAITLAQDALAGLPRFTDLVFTQALANLALARPDAAEALFERCIEMGDAPTAYAPTVGCGSYLPAVHLAELLGARGDLARAREMLERCLREHPGFPGAVAPYVNVSLASGCGPDAVVASLERLVPALPVSSRLELGAALARAGQAAAAEGQLRAVLAEEPRAPAVGLLEAVLEALLRAQDFVAFERLVGLLEATPLSVRERRELLAELYLRCGYAASAAEEWMAVCGGAPDARALVGLARVAAGRGMSREAGEFAAAALSCDPDNIVAARLLKQARAEVS
jgi:tetratricopeptide (TPR) repeat protein